MRRTYLSLKNGKIKVHKVPQSQDTCADSKTYTIKPLEWQSHKMGKDHFESAIGSRSHSYSVFHDCWMTRNIWEKCSSAEAGKAAAQAHHEAYIKQFLEEVV